MIIKFPSAWNASIVFQYLHAKAFLFFFFRLAIGEGLPLATDAPTSFCCELGSKLVPCGRKQAHLTASRSCWISYWGWRLQTGLSIVEKAAKRAAKRARKQLVMA